LLFHLSFLLFTNLIGLIGFIGFIGFIGALLFFTTSSLYLHLNHGRRSDLEPVRGGS